MTILINLLRLSCFLVWGLFFATQAVNGQNVSAQIGNYTSTSCQPGDTISIPVTIISAPGIGVSAISLAIEYDTTKLECLNHITGLNPVLSGAFIGNCGNFTNLGTSYNLTGKQFRVSWYQLNPVQLSGLAFNLSFRVLSPGSSSIQWDLQTPEVCGFYNELAEEISQVSYQNGSIQCNNNPYNLQTDLTHVGDCLSSVGDTLDVPVTLQNFNGLGITSISMAIDYDSTKLRCLPGVIALNPSLTSGFLSNSGWFNNLGPNANAFGSQFRAVWNQISPVNLSGTLFNIRFITKVPGTHNIVFDNQTPGNCEYSDSNALVIPNTHWTNGSVTASSLPLHLFAADTLFLCGDSTTIGVTPGLGQYLWNTGDTLSNLTAKRSGWFTCIATLGNCQVTDSLYVSLISDRIVQPTMPVCAGTTVTLQTIGNYSNSLRQGMIAHWPFNGQAGSTYGINRPNDYEQIGYTTDRFGLAGRAASFNGSNQYIQTNQPVLTAYGPYSISFWAQSNSGSDMEIFSQACPSDCQINGQFFHDFRVQLNAGQCQALGLSFKNESHFATANTITNDGLWHHYTLVVGSNSNHSYSNIEFYKDGQFMFVNCGHNWGGWQYMLPQVPTRIGAPVKGGTVPFQGNLDEITVWNRALNRSEINDMLHEQPTRYLWSTGDTTPNITVNPLQTTTYYVTISNGIHSCLDSVTVNVLPIPANSNLFASDTLFHCGDSLVINAGAGFDRYEWSTSDTTQTKTVRNTGWYRCRVYSGLCTVEDSVFVSIMGAKVDNEDEFICTGDSVTLTISFDEANFFENTLHKRPKIGDQLFGGLVAYIVDSNERGFKNHRFNGVVVANHDLSNRYTWGGFNSTLFHGLSNELGAGKSNTNLIMRVSDSTFSQFPAAKACYDFIDNGFSDWYLPSVDELVRIRTNLAQQGLGGFKTSLTPGQDPYWSQFNTGYWSSSMMGNGAGGLAPFFANQGICGCAYFESYWVRPVRDFEISPYNFLWSTGDTTASINVTPTQTTTYYVTISNGIHSCMDSVTVNVLPNPLNPNLFASDTLFHCGDSLVLDAGPGFDRYEWSTSDTTRTNTVRNTGWYRCRVFDGLCSVEDSVFVSIIPELLPYNDTTICSGSSIELNLVARVAGLSGSLRNGLVGYWPFNGNANDESGNGNHGSVNGAMLSTDRFGNSNKTYSFDGINNYIDCGTNTSLGARGNQTISISTWFLADSTSGGNIISKYYNLDAANSNYFLGYDAQNTRLRIAGNGTDYLEKDNVSNGQWIHIIAIFSAGTNNSKIYFNGIKTNQGTLTFNNSIVNTPLNIGRVSGPLPGYFKGKIDDIGIWNRELTASEIETLYNAGHGYEITWSTGDTTASITVSPTQTTTYYVTVSNGIHSCTDSVTVNVLPNPLNSNLFPSDTLFHCGDSLVIDAGAGFDRYEWSTSDTTQTKSVRYTGWYRCRVYSGLCSVEDSVFVSLNSYRITQDDTAICMGTAIVLGTISTTVGSPLNLIIPEGSVYQADSVRTILSNQAVTGSRTIEVVQSTDFKIGDLLCITTSQVNSISDSNLAGVYELRRVIGINGQIFTIEAPLEHSYPLPQNAVTQVIRVPEFNEVWVEGTLACKEWDGTTGGILMVRANKITVSNNGRITADAKGFRGGQEVSGWGGGYQGEGPYGVGGRNYEPNGSGGGGGNAEWCHSGQGGGGGGYSNVGENGIIHCNGCGGGWWFSSGCGTSGFGGQALSNHTGRMLMGSGGGSGGIDGDNPDGGGWGGRGGGVVCLLSAEINSTSNGITSQGGNGHSAPGETGGGGGGSGGAVWHTGGLSVVPQWISVSGGVGGQGYYGGNGSEGVRVQLNASAFSSLSENVLWSTGDTTASINVTPTQTTTYYVTISNGIHSCVDSVTVRVSPKIFVPNMEVCQGDTINVPVIATRLDSVAAISLALNYNDQAMTYVGNTGLRSDMVSTTSIGTAPGQVRMAWFGLTPLISNSADTLVYYQFVVHQPGSFGWNIQVQGDCELADLNLNILDYCFEGGSLSLVDTVTILSSSQGPYIVEVGDSIHLNVQSSGALNQRWQIWNGNLSQWDNLQDNGAYQGTSTPSLTYHCLTYQRPFPKFRLELSNGCRFWYGPEMPISIKQRISVSLGSSVGCEGDTLEIPVIISGGREVGAVSLVFAFNANSLQLVDWINSAPQTSSNQWFVNQVGNEIRLAWFSLQSANIPDGQPLGVLKVVGLGSSGLIWDLVTPSNCEFGDEEASSIPASFVSGSLTIHPLPSVQLSASAQAICPNGGVSVLSTVADPSYTYQWYLNGQLLTGSTGDSHLAGQSGLYQVKVTNTNGCTRWSTIQTISDHPLPNPVVQAVGNTMTCEQPVLLNASATQGNSLEFWWYLNGIPLSSTPSAQWTATQSGDYSVKALDLSTLCEAWSPTVAININPIPTSTISYTGSTTFCQGDSLTLLANTNLGTDFQWAMNGQPITDATNPTFVARQQGTYAVVVSTALGCTSTSGSINVWVQNCNAINGRLSYNNTLRTPLRNTKILFQDSAGSILDSTTTNNVGDYSFSGYSNGFYRVKAAPNLTWGGVNATDALAIVRHYTNYVLLQGFRLQAADVNGSNNVNNTDALLITRRYSNLVPTFNVGAWLSENPIVQANGQTITQNIQTLCYGDVNGSYNPVQTRLAPKISLVELGTLSAPNNRFHLPIYSLDNQELGAISLAMVLPKGTRVLKVHSKIPEGIMEYGQWEDELRIGWFTQNQFAVKEGELLFELELCMDGDTKEFGPSDIEVRGLSELANFWAIPYDMARLGVPSVKIWSKSPEDLIIWPNPTNENARLRLTTSEPVLSYSLRVLDAVGREVYQENPSIVKIGDVQELVLPSAEWAKGIYAVQTNWTTLNGLNKSKTVMLRRE